MYLSNMSHEHKIAEVTEMLKNLTLSVRDEIRPEAKAFGFHNEFFDSSVRAKAQEFTNLLPIRGAMPLTQVACLCGEHKLTQQSEDDLSSEDITEARAEGQEFGGTDPSMDRVSMDWSPIHATSSEVIASVSQFHLKIHGKRQRAIRNDCMMITKQRCFGYIKHKSRLVAKRMRRRECITDYVRAYSNAPGRSLGALTNRDPDRSYDMFERSTEVNDLMEVQE